MIEALMNWVFTILQEETDAMSVSEISDSMDRELHKVKSMLDVLLSLDPRFMRVGHNTWKPNTGRVSPNSTKNVEEFDSKEITLAAINLREKAISNLLSEKSELAELVDWNNKRLQEINKLLRGLDYFSEPKIIHANEQKLDVNKSRESDSRYRSVWPLPGGKDQLLENVIIILEYIAENNPDWKKLVDWFQKYYDIGNWAKHSLLACIIYPGFVERQGDSVRITELGRNFLSSHDLELVSQAIRKSFWGIEEMIDWLTNQSMTVKQLLEQFNMIGAGWQKIAQVNYRLSWLLACKVIQEVPDSHPILYKLSRS